MKSGERGTNTSKVEVTNVSTNGIWLLIDQREFLLKYADFPWFKDATIRQISKVERPSAHHLRWPELDVDLAVDSLENPKAYPLVSTVKRNKRRNKVATKKRGPRSLTPRASRSKGSRA